MPDKVTITPADGKIVFQAVVDGTLTEVGSIDAEAGNGSADQIVIDKARLTNSTMNGGSF
jgi:hypothetical protein